MLANLKRRLMGGEFARNVAKIAGGTAIGQGLVMASMPLLTRIYTPEHFGLQGVYVSVLSMLVVVACLRFELAIPLPKEDGEAAHVLVLALLSVGLVTLLTLAGCLFLGGWFLTTVRASGLRPYLVWVLPIGVFGGGAYQAMSYWALRRRDYARLAKTRVQQGLAQVVTQIGLGLLPFGPLGLLAGADVGRLNGTGTLVRSALEGEGKYFKSITREGLRSMASRYREFPLLSAGSALINAAGLYIPVILFTRSFDTRLAGQFSLAQRIIAIPIALIGQAVAQVYMAEGAALLRDRPAELHALLKRTIRKLLLLGAPPVLLLALMGPWGFRLVFGPKWGEAGLYVRILCPMYLLQFVAFPVSQTLSILERQGLQIMWDVARLVAVVAAILIPARLALGPTWTVASFGFALALLYLAMLELIEREARKLTRGSHA
ncbi:MAG TPA: lipopolysaccharide biosynthesis protein [Holophagaceae bacterium]|nr:lipopolysaccharide biosynthesis protein [Holophagaceae bacterium]